MNEVAAPFAALGVAAGDERAAAAAFGAFVGRYGAAVYLAPAGTEATAQTVDGFGALALYHDPAVAAALAARGWPAQLAATPWLLTLGAKAAGNLASCCRIFDAVIAADDAAHVFCVGVGLLAARRTELLAGARAEAAAGLRADGGAARAAALAAAAAAARATPPGCLAALRCALAGGDAPAPAPRGCLVLSAADLAARLGSCLLYTSPSPRD